MFKLEIQNDTNNTEDSFDQRPQCIDKSIKIQLCLQEILQEDFTIFLNKVGKILSYLNIDSINITTEMKED